MPSESILQEADRIAGEDRSRDYGHPYDNHLRIARLWNAYLGPALQVDITPADVATMMILLKIARMQHSYKRDSAVDVCGYAKCLDMIHEHPGYKS